MTIKFCVTGMTCAACSARVEKVTRLITGVTDVHVNLLAGTMMVTTENPDVSGQIIQAVQDAGYGAGLFCEKQSPVRKKGQDYPEMKRRIIISFAFLAILMYFTMGHMVGIPSPSWYHGPSNVMLASLLQFFLTLPVIYLNRIYYSRGLKALWNRAPNMDSLIAVGSGVSLVYSIVIVFMITNAVGVGDLNRAAELGKNLYFESAAMILTLITLGKFLESRAKGKTGDAIEQLMDLAPKTATVRQGDVLAEIPIEDVQIGMTVVVRTGGSIPVDGTVLEGHAAVDQSALTGESVPVEKCAGDKVSAATINTDGYIEVLAEGVGEDTTLAQVIHMVEEAGGSKAPIARLADKIAGIFVPVVICIALVTLCAWLIAGKQFAFSLNMAISVLVISCPCALGLATPVAIMVGTGRGAGMGVLFKNAEALEQLHKIDTVVLDKTGTLTKGTLKVTDVVPENVSDVHLLSIAASLESRAEHPFAKAIMEKNGQNPFAPPVDFESLPGKGVCAIINDVKYYGGNHRLMQEIGVRVKDYPDLKEHGKTPVYFANAQGEYLGVIAAADVLKDDSSAAVSAMKKMKLDVVMLTGDNEKTAQSIAAGAGIDHVISDVLPNEKAGVVARLQAEGRHVLMVGDGINDAPALVTADVGMSVANGTDIAIESADVVLMKSTLCGVCDAVSLSRATIRNIKQNLFWAFFYNILGVPIAAGVLYPSLGLQLSPMIGAAAMSFSSVFVVTNALRLRMFKNRTHMQTMNNEEKTERTKVDEKMETVIKVEGMMCPHCKARVEKVCKEIPGTLDAVVDLEAKQVCVTGTGSVDALKNAITDAGYEVVE